jgi:hypothetical protein
MLRIFLLALLFIWLFRFVLRFVLPILKITSGVRRQMKNMQQGQSNPYTAPSAARPQKVREGDYIDYEEVK